MFDFTLHLDTIVLGAAILSGAYKVALSFRDKIQAIDQTVYGSEKPPVEGLVHKVERHEKILFPERRV